MALDRYLPFGGGPRKCLGDMFATFEVHNPAPVVHISFHLRYYLTEACEMLISWFPFRGFEILPSICCKFEGFEEFKRESTSTLVKTRLCGQRLFKISPIIWRLEMSVMAMCGDALTKLKHFTYSKSRGVHCTKRVRVYVSAQKGY